MTQRPGPFLLFFKLLIRSWYAHFGCKIVGWTQPWTVAASSSERWYNGGAGR